MNVITRNPIIFDRYSNFNNSSVVEVKAFQVWNNSKNYSPKLSEKGEYDFLTKMAYTNHGAEYETSKGKDFAFDVTAKKEDKLFEKPLFKRDEPSKRVTNYIQSKKEVVADETKKTDSTKKPKNKNLEIALWVLGGLAVLGIAVGVIYKLKK